MPQCSHSIARCWRCGWISPRSAAADLTSGDADAPDDGIDRRSGAKIGVRFSGSSARLKGSGPIDLSPFADARGDEATDWKVVLSTEEPPFALDPAPPQIDMQCRRGRSSIFRGRARSSSARHRDPSSDLSQLTLMKSPHEYAGNRPRYVPASTYRLQIHRDFPLTDATAIVPYLARLGVDACYTSPYFTAAPGSTHGYDVADHNEINPEVGGAEAHGAFSAALARLRAWGTSSTSCRTTWASAPATTRAGTTCSRTARARRAAIFFDVDWSPVKAELHAKLLLPILGDQYGRVLERGELQLAFEDGLLVLRYFERTLPINAREASAGVRRRGRARQAHRSAPDSPHLNEFLSIITSLQNLPPYTERDPARIAERQREKEVARTRLVRLVCRGAGGPGRRSTKRSACSTARPEIASSFDALHRLLEAQAYRLAYWRTASHEINYRRFFDINTLAGLRIENKEVFDATHQLLGELIRDGKVQAVRIDHPDGLFDPRALLRRCCSSWRRMPGRR